MIVLLSPAKTLDFSATQPSGHSQPRLLDRSETLVGELRKKSVRDLQQLMGISEDLAVLNAERYADFRTPFSPDNAKPAILAFRGDVYTGLQAETLSKEALDFAQRHLRILSGLYGLLRPLDLMQPYRLEMGTRLKNEHGKNLYAFWDDQITRLIEQDLEKLGSRLIVNLASKEYFRALHPKLLNAEVYDIHFREKRNGEFRFISFNAKKARGQMARFIVEERITDIDRLKAFEEDGYALHAGLSDGKALYFTR